MENLIEGQKVMYKDEVRTIYGIYENNKVSLCLVDEDGYEYDDVEEDYCVDVKNLSPIK
jgi:hypothetical protein